MIERILNVAIGPISGRQIDWHIPNWVRLLVCLPLGWLLGWLLNKYVAPATDKLSDRDLLWLILFSIWWLRR